MKEKWNSQKAELEAQLKAYKLRLEKVVLKEDKET
jgi:hypothetical protein